MVGSIEGDSLGTDEGPEDGKVLGSVDVDGCSDGILEGCELGCPVIEGGNDGTALTEGLCDGLNLVVGYADGYPLGSKLIEGLSDGPLDGWKVGSTDVDGGNDGTELGSTVNSSQFPPVQTHNSPLAIAAEQSGLFRYLAHPVNRDGSNIQLGLACLSQ